MDSSHGAVLSYSRTHAHTHTAGRGQRRRCKYFLTATRNTVVLQSTHLSYSCGNGVTDHQRVQLRGAEDQGCREGGGAAPEAHQICM
ncbi:hypothetical protein AAFF_G00230630 [Aldrovandia affinis]|uniref:Uncharacterized protein n=1 Tax=Aldrovandia affinis TaxID=143900 RepID=A0AAD7RFJ3_9TELE|nr:hypothetical protein AAFF_G00230630 [Aldrovandia affinis]